MRFNDDYGDDDGILGRGDARANNNLAMPKKNKSNANLSIMREMSTQILKENDNLDLSTYKPFMNEFYKYSSDIFDFEENIFTSNKKAAIDALLASNVKRTTDAEVKTIEKLIRR